MLLDKNTVESLRKGRKKGISHTPIVANVLNYSVSFIVIRQFALNAGLSLETAFDLVLISVISNCTITKLTIYIHGNNNGGCYQRVQKRVLTLVNAGYVVRSGSYYSLTDKAFLALQEVVISPELSKYYKEFEQRKARSLKHAQRVLSKSAKNL